MASPALSDGGRPRATGSLDKWVGFARQMLAVMLISIVTIAGLSALFSTKQAEGLLKESLSAQGRAVADALARAAFVPLTLEDKATLERLLSSYRGFDDVVGIAIRDAEGRALRERARGPDLPGTLLVRAPIVPIVDQAEAGQPVKPVGFVEVRLWSRRIEAKARTIALMNVLISGALTIAVSLVGFLMIRNLVTRMQDLVGEARLVEEVKQANAELESFSYSVSHDLRAPLRSIAGFSQMVLEDAAPKLDDSSKQHLQRVVSATKRMGLLIDDLIELSRVTRKEVKREAVDLTDVAKAVVAALRERDPSRRVDVVLAERLAATGDPQLLRIVLDNLIGNAWKYSSKRPDARIELGAAVDGAKKPVFFVKDNGAGFDMAYGNKLFGAFQRLHSAAEFEGTGIGLATVQRIIRKHGGRIWAQAAAGQGATFYFTL